MGFKTLMMATALLTIIAVPTGAAHWRGSYVDATGATITNYYWDAPHEHTFVLAGGVMLQAHSDNFQRMCRDPSGNIYWGFMTGCPERCSWYDCQEALPSTRSVVGLPNCVDLDSLGHPNYIKNALRQNGISSVVLDWGATAGGPGIDGKYNFADHFAHPVKSAKAGGVEGHEANPTGATPNFYPTLVVTTGGLTQLSVTMTGLGPFGTGTSHRVNPGVDVGDNDFEFCHGGAQHTYAIDSGDSKVVSNGAGGTTTQWGAGAGLNDILGIGGDGVYDTVTSSPVVGTGGNMPPSADSYGTPYGVLLHIFSSASLDSRERFSYTACNDPVGVGCTNIPTAGTQARLGNAYGEDAVYSSLQDCVWEQPASWEASNHRTHAGSGRAYRGVSAVWGTRVPEGYTCWPERLVRANALSASVYMPSSQAIGVWNPDELPVTYRDVEAITVFVNDKAPLQLFHGFSGGCPVGQSVIDRTGCSNPTVQGPGDWVAAPTTAIAGLSAVFQP